MNPVCQDKDCENRVNKRSAKYCSRRCAINNQSAEQRRKNSAANKGRKMSAATIKKMSEAHKRENLSAETLEKMRKSQQKKRSPETLEKMSYAARNRSLETLRKLSIAQTGKKHSDETRKKMSDANKRAYERGHMPSNQCTWYEVQGIKCQGTVEKEYIEDLLKNGAELPTRPTGVKTELGYYFPDFEFKDRYIEIKSGFTAKLANVIEQMKKIKWVQEHIKPVEIIIRI